MLKEVAATRAYRPSPYLVLSHGSDVGCEVVEEMANAIAKSFDCSANYCHYMRN